MNVGQEMMAVAAVSDPTLLTLGDLARAVLQLEDPAIPLAISAAGMRCGIILAAFEMPIFVSLRRENE